MSDIGKIGRERSEQIMEIANVDLVREQVLALSETYMSGSLGLMEQLPNYTLHGRIEDLEQGFFWNDPEVLTEMREELEYRLDVIRSADTYVEYLGLTGPNGKSCSEWNRDEVGFAHHYPDEER